MTIEYLNQPRGAREVPETEWAIHAAAFARSAKKRQNWLLAAAAYDAMLGI